VSALRLDGGVSIAQVFAGVAMAEGRVQWADTDSVRRCLHKLAGKDIEVVIRRPRSKRSLAQNAYWHAVPVQIMQEFMGEWHDATHYALLGECWGYHFNDLLQRAVPNKGSSSSLTVEEFSRMIEWCPPWAMTTWQVQIPLPNECDYEDAA
jgi:hypothetical protein